VYPEDSKGSAVENIESDLSSNKGGRRTGIERREFDFTAYIPERRCGNERRRGSERRRKGERRKEDRMRDKQE